MRSGLRCFDFLEGDLVVAADLELLPHLAEILRQVVGERIVVVEQQNHTAHFISRGREDAAPRHLIVVSFTGAGLIAQLNTELTEKALSTQRNVDISPRPLDSLRVLCAEAPLYPAPRYFPPACAISRALITARALFADSSIFALGHRIGHDARARLDVSAAILRDQRAQTDAGIEIARKIEIQNRARRKFRAAWARVRR